MKRQLVSERTHGRHTNASSRSQKVNASGTTNDVGENVGRNHEHNSRANTGRIMDSPTYVPPVVIRCAAIRTDGDICTNEVRVAGEKCFGHRAGRGSNG